MNNVPSPYLPRVLSGIQPAKSVHLGHYCGALKQHIDLQHEYPGESFFVIADYHALTRTRDPAAIQDATLELATVYLALGLDPNKAILFRQSDVPQTFELYWVFSCFCSASELLRNPTWEAPEHKQSQNAGLLTYSVLMAADILAMRATIVPVGEDQRINVEHVRNIVSRFNQAYETNLLPVPTVRLGAPFRIPGTDGRKMSHTNNNTILPFAPFRELQRTVLAIKSDSTPRFAPKDPDKCIVFGLYAHVASEEKVRRMREEYGRGIDYAEAKRQLMFEIVEYFADATERYSKLKQDPDFVRDVLREGFRLAAQQTELTVDAVRQILGLSM